MPPKELSPSRELLLAQVREIYGRIVYTHKAHEKQADIYDKKDRRQRTFRVVLTAVSSGAFLASILGIVLNQQWGAIVTSFIAVLLSATTLAEKSFKHGEEMQLHRGTAAEMWDLRESYLSLIVDVKSGIETDAACQDRRDALQARAVSTLREAPRTTSRAYNSAQIALQSNDELTFTPGEIDHLLPLRLRDSGEATE